MEIWTRAALGNVLAALINGVMGGISVLLAIQIYKKWGWSILGSGFVLSVALQFAVLPVTSRIRRHFSQGRGGG